MLNPQQTEILRALVDTIIPADDAPSGWEAGVGDYLFRQFERDLRDQLPLYQQGLTALSNEAQAVFGAFFPDLSADQQTELLTKIERGQVITEWAIDPAGFFMMVCHHCAEGFYSNPENGGNRDQSAWKMIGFEVSQ